MAITNGYISLEDFKLRAGINDELDDAAFERIIEGMSRKIDELTWRRFYSTNETRYYTADETASIFVDDFTAIDALKTDEGGDRVYEITWLTTDYDKEPFNAALDGRPYTKISITPSGSYSFPKGVAKGVEIKGDFGFVSSTADTPALIEDACFLGANRLVARGETPLGVSASAAMGQMSVVVKELKMDPDFQGMLSSFIKGA